MLRNRINGVMKKIRQKRKQCDLRLVGWGTSIEGNKVGDGNRR